MDDRDYIFEFVYMTRPDAWYLSIYDTDDNPLRTGVRMVIDWPLLGRDRNPDLYQGVTLVIRLDDLVDVDPRKNDFDGNVNLMLVTGEDIPVAADEDQPLIVKAVP